MTLRRRSSWLLGSKSLDISGDPCEYECPVFGNSGVVYDERLIPPDRQSRSQTWEISSDVYPSNITIGGGSHHLCRQWLTGRQRQEYTG